MSGLIETAVAIAAISFNPATNSNLFIFEDTGAAAGEMQVAIVSVHNRSQPFPASQNGWVKIVEVGLPGWPGPKTAAYSKVRQLGDAGYVLSSGKAPFKNEQDERAAGFLVSVAGASSATYSTGVVDGSYQWAVQEQFAPPIGFYTTSANLNDLVIYGVFDNSAKYNSGVGSYVTDGISVHMPVVKPTSFGPVYLEFTIQRQTDSAPEIGYYAGVWVKLSPSSIKPKK